MQSLYNPSQPLKLKVWPCSVDSQYLNLLLKLATKMQQPFRNPKIHLQSSCNPGYQKVEPYSSRTRSSHLTARTQLLSDRICYVCGLQHHYFYTVIMSNYWMSYNIIMTSSVKLFFGQPLPWSITICSGFLIQSYHLAWLSEWVPDCTDPILSCSNTLGMQFLVSWIALGLQWDFGLQKACGNIGPS